MTTTRNEGGWMTIQVDLGGVWMPIAIAYGITHAKRLLAQKRLSYRGVRAVTFQTHERIDENGWAASDSELTRLERMNGVRVSRLGVERWVRHTDAALSAERE